MWKSVILGLVLLSPEMVSAAGLVPCGGAGEEPCQLCHIGQLLALVGNWLAIVMGSIVVIIIMISGLRIATSGGDLSAVNSSRRLISNAIIGYVVFLAAWLLVDTGLRFILDQDEYGVWNPIQCVAQPVSQAYSRPTASGDNATTLPPTEIDGRVDAIESSGSVQTDITNAAGAAGLTEEQTDVFRALISQESSNCANRTGPPTASGVAYGCGQLQVRTARELDPSLAGLTDAEVIARIRDDNAYNLTLSARNFDRLIDRYNGDINSALAHYNGGYAAMEPSRDCPGQRAWQCVWDSPGCYNTGRTDCARNTGFQETRNYVTNIRAIASRL